MSDLKKNVDVQANNISKMENNRRELRSRVYSLMEKANFLGNN